MFWPQFYNFFVMKKKLLYILLILVACMPLTSVNAQYAAYRLPVVELVGENYYVYTAAKGESLFGIARKFGWNTAKLQELNPSVVSPVKKGTRIYYPVGKEKSAVSSKPSVKTSTDEIRHTVKRGETVYGLSSMYDVPVETIYTLNPSSRNGLTPGESLLIKNSVISGKAVNEGKSVFYTVRPGDTLYSLGQDFGVSVAAILKINPGISEDNFKAGSNIKIPKKGTGINSSLTDVTETNLDAIELVKVGKNDSWAAISYRTGVPEEMLREANPDVTELKKNSYVSVPKLDTVTVQKEVAVQDPREQSEEGISEIYEDVHKIADADGVYTVKVAVVASAPSSNKDAEYLRGFLTGVDRIKRENYHIDLKVIDGTKISTDVIEELDSFKPTVVFLTTDNDIPSFITEYAEVSQTPVVNVFDTKSTAYTENPYIIQLLTPPTLFNDNIAHYISSKYYGRTIIFVGEPDDNDLLAESLKKIWNPDKIRTSSVDDILPQRFYDDGKYLIYGYPVNRQEVTKLMTNIAAVMTEKPLAEINTIGRPNLIVFEDNMAQAFHKANVSIPSRFYVDKESSAYHNFLADYRLLFDRMPVKSLPLYAAVGYDNASYFIPAIADTRGDINRLPVSRGTVQNDFELWRTSNWSGFLNPPVYMIDFTPYGLIEKNIISYGE